MRKKSDWVALALGVGMIPVCSELTCYYYSVFLILGFLWAEERAVGIALLLLSALTCLLSQVRPMEDESFYWISIAVLLFFAFACVAIGRARKPPEALPAPVRA